MGQVARMRKTRAYTKFHKDRLKKLVVNVRIILKCTAELWSDDVQCHLAPDWGSMTNSCEHVKKLQVQ
jgi:hypothetical protein